MTSDNLGGECTNTSLLMFKADSVLNCPEGRIYWPGVHITTVAMDLVETRRVTDYDGSNSCDVTDNLTPKVWVRRDVERTKHSGNPGQIH